jgi:hypothetical protein
MSLHLAGWVECKHPTSFWFRDEWAPVINVEPLLDDELDLHYSAPFVDHVPEAGQRLASGHGLPDDVSAFVAHEAGQWMVPYYSSWVTWAELKALRTRDTLPDDWRLVMAMVEPLAPVCGDEGVRLILWESVSGYDQA